MANKKFYAVAVGRRPGIYTQWFGSSGAQIQVNGFKGARYKSFPTRDQAHAYIQSAAAPIGRRRKQDDTLLKNRSSSDRAQVSESAIGDRTVIYTDGSSLGNPGPGGYGVVVALPEGDREYAGGYRKTTNNRMELLACIVGLEQVPSNVAVALYSDSRYVVDGITKGWAKKWKRNGWRKSTGEPALNVDLWERLLTLCDQHDVRFIWVKGHAGNPGNERCDNLASQAAAGQHLSVDSGYETPAAASGET
jgi:ribonuclease HI